MKIYEIHQLKDEEIKKQIADEETNLLDLRFTHALKNLTNTAKLKTTKRNIARLRTVLKQRARLKNDDQPIAAPEGDQK
jgi:large subunit ribosomal protein L29